MCIRDRIPGRRIFSGIFNLKLTALIFFHPDYTVGFGISPNQPLMRVAGCTAGRESHPAPKIIYQFDPIIDQSSCICKSFFLYLFPSIRQISHRILYHLIHQCPDLLLTASSLYQRIVFKCLYHQLFIAGKRRLQHRLMIFHMGRNQLKHCLLYTSSGSA